MAPELVYTSDGGVGTPFVTGNLVRLEAGSAPGELQVAYTVRDSAGNSATSTVTFEVVASGQANAAPRPQALTAWAVSGETTRIPVPLSGIDPDGDSVTLVGIEQSPARGTVELGTEWLEYTPGDHRLGRDRRVHLHRRGPPGQAGGRPRARGGCLLYTSDAAETPYV